MAESSIGVKLQYSLDSGSTWTSAGCIVDVDMPGIDVDMKEGQCLSQTTRWKTFFAGFVDAGEFTASVDWSKTGYNTLLGMAGDDPIPWRIVVPDGTDLNDPTTCSRLQCDGAIQKLGLTLPSDGGRVVFPLTLKLSGAPTFTEAP